MDKFEKAPNHSARLELPGTSPKLLVPVAPVRDSVKYVRYVLSPGLVAGGHMPQALLPVRHRQRILKL